MSTSSVGHRRSCAAAIVTAAVLGMPAAARADDAPPVATLSAEPPIVATAAGMSVTAKPAAVRGAVTRFRGTAAPRRLIRIQRLDPEDGWQSVARSRVKRNGRFVVRWRPDQTGQVTLRALSAGAAAQFALTVYRRTLATWYGPGFFGNHTACGQVLTPQLLGVANRTLPCGTLVAFTYKGRSLVVPVVDRGPYGLPGANWDLTQGTAQALGMTQTVRIGALRIDTP